MSEKSLDESLKEYMAVNEFESAVTLPLYKDNPKILMGWIEDTFKYAYKSGHAASTTEIFDRVIEMLRSNEAKKDIPNYSVLGTVGGYAAHWLETKRDEIPGIQK
jgi:hypothetical protein